MRSRPEPARRADTVWLVGFMLAGKTTLGRLLARELDRPFHDLDRRVERAAGRSVAELFREEGEEGFRVREARELRRVAGGRRVVATGGGAVEREENRRLLRASGLVVWLDTPFAILWARSGRETGGVRPLWGDEPSLRRRFAARRRLYRFAHRRVAPVPDEAPEQTARRVARIVRAWEARG